MAAIQTYFHPHKRMAGGFENRIDAGLRESEVLVFFVSSGTGDSPWQLEELNRPGNFGDCLV